MPYARKKPVVVRVDQWFKNGDHPEDGVGKPRQDPLTNDYYTAIEGDVVGFFRHPEVSGNTRCNYCAGMMHDHGWIDTLEGGHIVCPGDWIITGVHGEFYPCKPDIFAKTYDVMPDE